MIAKVLKQFKTTFSTMVAKHHKGSATRAGCDYSERVADPLWVGAILSTNK